MPPDARKLTDWLHEPRSGIHQILTRAEQLAHVNHALRDWLQEPWAGAVRLARLDGETAVFYVADASVSTLLRFRAPAIIDWLRKRHCPDCTRIQIKVRPVAYAPY